MLSLPLYKQAGCASAPGAAPYLWLTVGYTLLVFVVEFWLDLRQLARFNPQTARIPRRLERVVKQETFDKSIAYKKDLLSFKMVESCFTIATGIAMILAGYLPWAWDLSSASCSSLMAKLGFSELSPFMTEFITTWILMLLLTVVDAAMNLPFGLYHTFVIEERHGFNKTTLLLFIKDKLIAFVLTAVLMLPLLAAVIYYAGFDEMVYYIWGVFFAFSVIMLTIYPTVIAPLFNKYTKLEQGELLTAIQGLAGKVEFPLTEIYTVDGSRRSAHSNAYFYGFFKNKRIVLYDTLFKQVTLSELLAILGHEMGHWKLWHTLQNFVVTQVYFFALLSCYSFAQHSAPLFTSFGFAYSRPMPVFVGIMLFVQTLWSPVDKTLSLVLAVNSRRNEFAADHFAASLDMGPDLVSGLIKLSIENLDNLVPDPWYSWYHYSHPPLVERIAAIESLQRKGQ